MHLSISHSTQGEHLLAGKVTNTLFWLEAIKPYLR